jgi:2'-5' RNA ligase
MIRHICYFIAKTTSGHGYLSREVDVELKDVAQFNSSRVPRMTWFTEEQLKDEVVRSLS